MTKAIKLDDYLNRQQEILNAYIETKGKETDLLPYLEKYSKQDGNEYEKEDVLRYIKSYITSKNASKDDLNRYKKSKMVSNEIIFKRGKIITEALIKNKNDYSILTRYQIIFAKIDHKFKPYSINYLLKCRDYYLEHTKHQEIKDAYKNVVELSKRGEYDIELINAILKIENNDEAIKFIKSINISASSLRNLIKEYEVLYPANRNERNRLNNLFKDSRKEDKKVIKFIEAKKNLDTLETKLYNLKRMLDEFLTKDIEDISTLFEKYHFSEYKFQETLKDAKTSRDIILKNLIAKYEAKVLSIGNTYVTLIYQILKYYDEGIMYQNTFKEMNAYDLYILTEGVDITKLKETAKNNLNPDLYEKFLMIIESYDKGIEHNNISSLAQELDIKNDDEILEYMVYANIPLTVKLYNSLQNRIEYLEERKEAVNK